MRPRVAYVTQWFDPEPVPKGANFVRALKTSGLQVSTIAAFPSYPAGKTYPGYRQSLWKDDNQFGLALRRVATFPSHDSSLFKRGLTFATFFLSATAQLLNPRFKYDVLLAYHPPITTAFAVMVAGKVRRKPYVLDVQDLWPESFEATGIGSPRAHKIIGLLMNATYRRAAAIITGSDGLGRLIAERSTGAESKISAIYNWCDESRLFSGEEVPERREKFVLLFAGNLGYAQDLDNLLDAAALLQQRGAEVVVRILGDGPVGPSLHDRVDREGLNNVELPGHVLPSVAGSEMQAADALLVCLRNDPLFRATIPSKCQAYLAAGKPIIVSVGGEADRLVVDLAKAGFAAKPSDPESLVQAVEKLARMSLEQRSELGSNGKKYYETELSLAAGASKTAQIIQAVVANSK